MEEIIKEEIKRLQDLLIEVADRIPTDFTGLWYRIYEATADRLEVLDENAYREAVEQVRKNLNK